MNVLLTGASSFTGAWFAGALARAGHRVTASFQRPPDAYEGPRGERIRALKGVVEPVWETSFGDPRFVDLVGSGAFDVLCHHAADATDYRSWDFDPLAATAANTRAARAVLETLAQRGGRALVVTGSVFEPYEGLGDATRRAFNPYGLSKHFSFEVLRMEAERIGLGLGKFVIPNPFGPGEEFRFTSFLAREWMAGRTPKVATPDYVRDNIHVSLLAQTYVGFVAQAPDQAGCLREAPSGYVESQGAFARRMSRELSPRLGRPCEVELATQTEFPEPLMRVNEGLAAPRHPAWSESGAWDALGEYYRATFG